MLFTPGSCYYKLNQFLSPLFDKVLGTNIETSTLNAWGKLESIKLGPDESIVPVELKSLYANDPPNDVIQIVLKSLYSNDQAPDMSKSNLKILLKLAVANDCFKCNDK